MRRRNALSKYGGEIKAFVAVSLVFIAIYLSFTLGLFARKTPLSEMIVNVTSRLGPFPSSPYGVAYGDGLIWVSLPKEGEILALTEDGKVVRRIKVTNASPTGVAWGEGKLWVLDAREGRVLVVDPQSQQVVDEMCRELVYPTAITYWSGLLYVYDSYFQEMIAFNPSLRNVVWRTKYPVTIGLAASEEGLWALLAKDYSIVLLSWSDISRVKRRYYSPTPAPYGLDWGDRSLWICDISSCEVLRLDPYARMYRVVGSKPPSWLAFAYAISLIPIALSALSKIGRQPYAT